MWHIAEFQLKIVLMIVVIYIYIISQHVIWIEYGCKIAVMLFLKQIEIE
jgi:hypothetical protein